VPVEIQDDVEFLRANVDLAMGKPAEAVTVLQPLKSDPSLSGKGRSVLEAKEDGGALVVKVSGKVPGEDTTIRMDRNRMLPESFESSAMSMKVRYTEVLPGKFAQARLDIQIPGQAKSSATFTYQRVGNLVFPSTVVAASGGMSARLEFLSLSVDKPGR